MIKPNSIGYIKKLMKNLDEMTKYLDILNNKDNTQIRRFTCLLGVFFENVRAEQLGVRHPRHLPDIGIFRSILTEKMIMAGRMGISEELVTSDMPYLNIHEIKEIEECDMNGDIDLEEIEECLDEDMRLNIEKGCLFYRN